MAIIHPSTDKSSSDTGKCFKNLVCISTAFLFALTGPIDRARSQVVDETAALEEKSYTKIENEQYLRIAIKGMDIDLSVNNFFKEINNNHSYKISLFSYILDNRSLLIPFENSDHTTDDYLSSSMYEQCHGKSTLFRVKDGSLYVLQLETPYDPNKNTRAVLRRLEKTDGLAGDTAIQFSFVREFHYKRTCKD